MLNGPAAQIWRDTGQPDLHSLRPAPEAAPPAAPQFPSSAIRIFFHVDKIKYCLRVASIDLANELWPRLAALQISDDLVDHELCMCEYLGGIALYRDGICFATAPFVTGARAIILQELTRLAVPNREFLATIHGGAVGTSESCAILAGTSFSGKSTLCAALMQSGLLCYGDDSVVFTPDFRICGMPFPISLRETSWRLFPSLDKPRFVPSTLNGASPTVPPAVIIFVDYQATAGAASLATLDVFETLVALQQAGFGVEHNPDAITSFLQWLGRVPIYRLTYSDLQTAVVVVRQLLLSSAP
jgi:hypothetical protein